MRTRNLLAAALIAAVSASSLALAGTSQVDVTTSATAVAAGGTNRSSLTVKNHTANTANVYCKAGTAATTTGLELAPGEAYTWDDCQTGCEAAQAFTCISASGTQRVSVDTAE